MPAITGSLALIIFVARYLAGGMGGLLGLGGVFSCRFFTSCWAFH